MEPPVPIEALPGFTGNAADLKVLRELLLGHMDKQKERQKIEDYYHRIVTCYDDLKPRLQALMADMLTFIAPASTYLGCTGFGGSGSPELIDSISILYELVQTEVNNDFIEDHCIIQIRQFPSNVFADLSEQARPRSVRTWCRKCCI